MAYTEDELSINEDTQKDTYEKLKYIFTITNEDLKFAEGKYR